VSVEGAVRQAGLFHDVRDTGTVVATATDRAGGHGHDACTDGRFFIDKRYRGIRIGMRVGRVSQDQAEQRLQREIQHIEL
jgi:hypothetical protein